MSNKNIEKLEYLTPVIKLCTAYLERGFALSLENPEYDPEQDW